MKFFKIVTPILLMAFFSCSTSPKKDGEKQAQPEMANTQEANDVIKFNNKFIQLSQEHSRFISSLTTYLAQADRYIHQPDAVVNILPMAPMMVELSTNKPGDVPKGFGKEQSKMQELFQAYTANYDSLKSQLESLKNYLKAEDFKDDAGALFKQHSEKMNQRMADHVRMREELFTILTPVADAAEVELLKDHPFRNQILSSKKMLNEADELVQEVQNQYEGGKFNEAALQTHYNKLEAALNANREQKIKGDEFKSEARSLENLNKEAETFLSAVRKLMRDAKNANNISDEDINPVDRAYRLLISSYNTFVN